MSKLVKGWSKAQFGNKLTKKQHNVNDVWFNDLVKMLNPGGQIGVPVLGKFFDAEGNEVEEKIVE